MPIFSQKSLNQLNTCAPDLQILFKVVIQYFDCVVNEGYRNKEDQEKDFQNGTTKLHWPHGKHNAYPSNAVDVYPFEPGKVINWNDTKRMMYFAGYVMGISKILFDQKKISHRIRWGGDWNQNTELTDETFPDLGHFELINT